MAVKIITGNIWTSSAQTIVNTVNCEGVMGAGIALESRLRFPEMFEKYKEICAKGLLRPGLLWLYQDASRWILNFPTKDSWKQPSREEYLHEGLKKFCDTYSEKKIQSIAFPLLGASLGGINPERALQIMEYYLTPLALDIEIYHYDPAASDDIFCEIKEILLGSEKNLEELSRITKIQARFLGIMIEGLKNNPKICQVNQLLRIKGVGVGTLEKLFAFYRTQLKNTVIESQQTTFEF